MHGRWGTVTHTHPPMFGHRPARPPARPCDALQSCSRACPWRRCCTRLWAWCPAARLPRSCSGRAAPTCSSWCWRLCRRWGRGGEGRGGRCVVTRGSVNRGARWVALAGCPVAAGGFAGHVRRHSAIRRGAAARRVWDVCRCRTQARVARTEAAHCCGRAQAGCIGGGGGGSHAGCACFATSGQLSGHTHQASGLRQHTQSEAGPWHCATHSCSWAWSAARMPT